MFLNRNFKELAFYIIFIVVLHIILNYVIGLSYITSGSMEPTLYTNDFMVYNRLAYIKNMPERGDIISFKNDSDTYCKRVIGIEGDIISFDKGHVYINEVLLEEEYILDTMPTFSSKTFVVPKGTVFVLGDNRMNSKDSRYWDNPFVDIDYIKGKVLWIMPIHRLFI